MDHKETELLLSGHGLTTAEITYRMPDFQSVLQTFVWQEYDLGPHFPKLKSFIEFWQDTLDGPLHSVKYCHRSLIAPGEWRKVDGEFLVN